MVSLHKLEIYDIDSIRSFISNEIEESIHIEFKSSGALSKKDSEKKEISKDVAAFANSDGGIIIYGIEEKNHKAFAFSFIDGNEFTKEWLEQIISSSISRNIPDIKIYPIRNESNISESVYVVQVPSSIEAPHMSRDKKYYKRYNFESVAMEEYEVRQLYGRKVQSKLTIDNIVIFRKSNDDDELEYEIEVDILNNGEKMEENYKVNVYFLNSPLSLRVFQKNTNSSNDVNFTRLDENEVKASVKGNTPIYPSEFLNVARINFSFKKEYLNEVIENMKLEVRLLYPNGEDLTVCDLGKTIGNFD